MLSHLNNLRTSGESSNINANYSWLYLNVILQNSKGGIKKQSLVGNESDLEIVTWMKAKRWSCGFWGQYTFIVGGAWLWFIAEINTVAFTVEFNLQ